MVQRLARQAARDKKLGLFLEQAKAKLINRPALRLTKRYFVLVGMRYALITSDET